MNFKLLLLDDDPIILCYLMEKISALYDNIDIISFSSYDEFKEKSGELTYDFVIADIFFGDANSIEHFATITKKGQIPLIYMSGADENTFDVYDTPHAYFLAKPINEEKLKKAIDKVINGQHYLTIKYFKKEYRINTNEILFLESDKRIVNVITRNNIYLTYGKLNDYEPLLPNNFIRINKSFLVNRKYIKSKTTSTIILYNGDEIKMSRNKKDEIRNVL